MIYYSNIAPETPKKPKVKSIGTQRPDKDDLISELVDTVGPGSVAHAQLSLLVETLEKLQREGILTHLNLTPEDIEMIKEEMRKVLESKHIHSTNNKYVSTHRTIYTGGSSIKATGSLNIGMKDPSLHYVNDDTFPSVSPKRPKTNVSPAMIAKFYGKIRKHKH